MELTVHLIFAGECQAAFTFYERCLGGRILRMLTYGESPASGEVPAEWSEKILHGTMALGNQILAGADVLPERYEPPQGFYVLLSVDELAKAERMFEALSQGGVVRLPIQKTFWSPGFGVVIDRFGVPWEINCEGTASA